MCNKSPIISSNSESLTIDMSDFSFGGSVSAIASKSHVHRLLICSALSDSPVNVLTSGTSEDIEATVASLRGLGSVIQENGDSITVNPIKTNTDTIPEIDCGESGSTLRFLLPVIGALGCGADIHMHGRLSKRPLSPLYEELVKHGLTMSPQGSNPLHMEGKLTGGIYTIAGNVSSQFVTGLLLGLPLLEEDSEIHVTGILQSRPYVNIAIDVLRSFSIRIIEEKISSPEKEETIFKIPGGQKFHTKPKIKANGDWSNAAFFLSAGAISDSPVTVTGLNMNSLQGDKAIVDILRKFGAEIKTAAPNIPEENTHFVEGSVTISPRKTKAIKIDAANIPDLVPILSVVAGLSEGTTVIKNIERLRIKESDRVKTIINTLSALGVNIYEKDKAIYIEGRESFKSCSISSFNDHRIAMSAAIAAIRAEGPITIIDPYAVKKSYPGFYEDFEGLSSTCSFNASSNEA